MAGGNAFLGERFRHRGDELQEGQTGVDVACALARLLHQGGNVVAGDVEQALEALRLLVRVNVNTLAVLDQLPFERLCVVDLDDTGGNGEKLRNLRGTEASCSRNDLEPFVVGSDGDGLNEAIVLDALGEFSELGFIECAAGVGGGLVDLVDGEELECAAILHGCSP